VGALVLLGGVAVLALGGALGAILDDPPRPVVKTTVPDSTTTTLAPVGSLGEVGLELQSLVERGRTVKYHAVYAVTDPELPEGLIQTLELWRDGEMFRSDIVEETSAGSRRQSTVVGESTITACETVRGVETCKRATAEPTDLPAAFVRDVVTKKPPPKLTVRDDDVAGYVARCFEAEDIGEICVAGDGVMLSILLQGANLLATKIDDNVPASTFDNATGIADG
jgi:hypothetical protein